MHTFRVAKGKHGWGVRLGDVLVAPCRSRLAAVEQAERMAGALRRTGQAVAVVIENDQDALRLAAPAAAASAFVWASRRELRAR